MSLEQILVAYKIGTINLEECIIALKPFLKEVKYIQGNS